jgi:hypothetical protein
MENISISVIDEKYSVDDKTCMRDSPPFFSKLSPRN